MIRAHQLTRIFDRGPNRVVAVNEVDLEIEEGQSVAIQGPSGSGKSTLLSILGLLDDATSGEVWFHGQAISGLSSRQKRLLRNGQLGWIFQNFNLIGNMDVLENVTLPLRYNPEVRSKEYRYRGLRVLNQVGLQDKANAQPAELSGGQQQRVAIARALVQQPSVLLADEPTGNLDSETGDRILGLLLDLVDSGTTLFVVTHDDQVAAHCQRRIHMLDGRVADSVQPALLATNRNGAPPE